MRDRVNHLLPPQIRPSNPTPHASNLKEVSPTPQSRLRIAAIGFLNPAPLMWDFEHPPLNAPLALRYQIDRMSPSECAARLAAGTADIGLIPIAALATTPGLRILPGCTIASKGRVRSLLLVRRAYQPLAALRSVAADTASRTTLAYARILFHKWGNPDVPFLPMAADLDSMLERADAAILIGDPALLALEERANRFERTGEELVYHDLAEEWHTLTGLPFVSAVWAAAQSYGCPGPSLLGTWDHRRRLHPIPHPRPAEHRCPGAEWSRTPPHPRTPSAPTSPPTSTTFSTKNASKAWQFSSAPPPNSKSSPPYTSPSPNRCISDPAIPLLHKL